MDKFRLYLTLFLTSLFVMAASHCELNTSVTAEDVCASFIADNTASIEDDCDYLSADEDDILPSQSFSYSKTHVRNNVRRKHNTSDHEFLSSSLLSVKHKKQPSYGNLVLSTFDDQINRDYVVLLRKILI